MSVVSYSSEVLNNIFDTNIENIDNQSILSVISDINKLKDNFEGYKKITTLKEFNIVNEKLILDILSDIKPLLFTKGVYIEKDLYNKLDVNCKLNVINQDPLSLDAKIYKEAIKILTNKIMRQTHTDNVLVLNFKLDNKFGVKCNEKYKLNEEEIKLVQKINLHFDKLIVMFKECMPGLKIININEGVYISGNSNRDIYIDEFKKIEISEEINLFLESEIGFKNEKIHVSNNGIRYFFKKAKFKNKDKLIVIFSAFSSDRAKYNYINTLSLFDCNKLYILDDYGSKGSYYLGLNGMLDIETSVVSLISNIMYENNILFKNVISVGSSKGGTAALYYGMKYNYGNIIVGAPQYKIGTYLSDLSIKIYAEEIFGEINLANRIKYDNLIRLVCNSNSNVCLLTSEGDNQYKKVLKEFENIAKELDIKLIISKCEIKHHNEISREFPKFLNEHLEGILKVNKIKNRLTGSILQECKKIYKILKKEGDKGE